MAQGAFNVSKLIEQLGLKNVLDMPVRENIQPVIALDSMAGFVPANIGRRFLAGGIPPANVAEFSTFELISLDPGGCVVFGLIQAAAFASQLVTVTQTPPVVWGLSGPVAHNVQPFGSEPSACRLNAGTVVAAPSSLNPVFDLMGAGWNVPMFLPHGSRMIVTARTANASFNMTFQCMGIAASQFEPS